MLSLILPTFNEAQNLPALLDAIEGALQDVEHELIIVDDDSPDGTWRVAEGLAEIHPAVRVLRRRGKKGLSSAVIDGFDMAKGEYLIVMDADGQHDPLLLKSLADALRDGSDLVIGSRYVAGGSVGEWVTDRRIISRIGTFIASRVSQVRVSDPLGGFFGLQQHLYRRIRRSLKPSGFKILLEILAHVPSNIRVVEIPLVFKMRMHGESKLSLRVHAHFLLQTMRLGLRASTHRTASFLWVIFFVLTLSFTFNAFLSVYRIRSILDPSLRAPLTKALTSITAREGWLLSDVNVESVEGDTLRFTHQSHQRFLTPTQYCDVRFSTHKITCVER